MGTTTSCEFNCNVTCNCFILDKYVKTVGITRIVKIKWIWTDDHQLALTESINIHNTIPTDITHIIKDFAYSLNNDFFVHKKQISIEKSYSKQKQLLRKCLCKQWYKSELPTLSSLPIEVIGQNKTSKNELISLFTDNHLPSLKSSYLPNDTIIRSVFVNDCLFKVSLKILDDSEKQASDSMKLIVFNETDSFEDIHEICRDQYMNNCIAVKMVKNKSKYNKINLIKQLNIPLHYVYPNKEQNVKDLFVFVIKYYWFRNVMHQFTNHV